MYGVHWHLISLKYCYATVDHLLMFLIVPTDTNLLPQVLPCWEIVLVIRICRWVNRRSCWHLISLFSTIHSFLFYITRPSFRSLWYEYSLPSFSTTNYFHSNSFYIPQLRAVRLIMSSSRSLLSFPLTLFSCLICFFVISSISHY